MHFRVGPLYLLQSFVSFINQQKRDEIITQTIMVDVQATRPVDEFLLNPTLNMDDSYVHRYSPTPSDDVVTDSRRNGIVAFTSSKKESKAAGTIHDFTSEPTYLQSYTSDEEVASPVDNEDFDSEFDDSDIESTLSIRESPSLEQLPQSANAVQLCSKAQAIQVVSAGKAKVVSMPKPVDRSPSPNHATSSTSDPAQSPVRRPQRMSSNGSTMITKGAQSASYRSSSEESSVAPIPRSVPEQPTGPNKLRRKRNLPPIQTTPSSQSPHSRSPKSQTPLTAQRAEFLKHDYPANMQPDSPTSPSTPNRKTHKVSSSFSLRSFGRKRRQDSLSDSSAGEESRRTKESEAAQKFPPSPSVRSPTSSAPRAAPKLVARGASERAPPVVLPPCPDQYNDDADTVRSPQWPLRKDSVATTSGLDQEAAMLKHQTGRKSLSAASVTAKA